MGLTHLETLSIPLFDLFYTGHLVQPIWQTLKLNHAMAETDGKLFREELGRFEQSALRGVLAKEDHLLEGYCQSAWAPQNECQADTHRLFGGKKQSDVCGPIAPPRS